MNKEEAIKILQEHIETLEYQLTGEGWKEITGLGVVEKTIQSRLEHKAYTEKHIKAYKMAVGALREN